MNYLAHAYLSFGDPQILAGNLISDFVKGRKKLDYPHRIQMGIQLHRDIDTFTDGHPVSKKAAEIFKPAYRLYGAAFLDVVYDHFLALELAENKASDFTTFAAQVYAQLDLLEPLLPENFRAMFPYMKEQNWLYNYQFSWGIQKSFEGLVHKAAYLSDSDTAFSIFQNNYAEFQQAYLLFFPELLDFSLRKFSDIH